jgi:peptide/nickel transport system substrate-binding protein
MIRLMLATSAAALLALPVAAETFRWAGTTDPQTMDPHAVNSAPVLGFLNNVYEGLVRRGPDMAIEGSLAASWEPIGDGRGLAVQPPRGGHVP